MDLKGRISTDFGPKWQRNSENRAKIKNVKCTSFSPLFYLGMTIKAKFSDLNRKKYHILYSSNVKKSLIFFNSLRAYIGSKRQIGAFWGSLVADDRFFQICYQ